jgi:hypothetical protein
MKKFLLLLIPALLVNDIGFTQCKSVEKKCLDRIKPYKFGGQGNYKVDEGKSVELVATFYGGEQYRVLYCTPDDWKNVQFNIYDQKRKLIYTNRIDEATQFYDFKPKKTQNYIVEVIVPFREQDSKNAKKGCFGILIGFK